MKTLKVSLVALVLAVGLGGAAAEKIQAAPKAGDQIYSWTGAGRAPFTGTLSQAEANYDCHNTSSILCVTGTAPGVPNLPLNKN